MRTFITTVAIGMFLTHIQSAKATEGSVDTLYQQAIALRNSGDLPGAKGCFMQVVDLSGRKHANALHNVGTILHKEKEYVEAAAFFREAAQLDCKPSQRNLWRMLIAKEIPSTNEERFLAVCGLFGYTFPSPRETFRFNLNTNTFENTGLISMPYIYAAESFKNAGTVLAEIVWVENEKGLVSLGTLSTKLLIVGSKRVI